MDATILPHRQFSMQIQTFLQHDHPTAWKRSRSCFLPTSERSPLPCKPQHWEVIGRSDSDFNSAHATHSNHEVGYAPSCCISLSVVWISELRWSYFGDIERLLWHCTVALGSVKIENMTHCGSLIAHYNENSSCRVDIWRDRCDRRSCKILVRRVNF